MEAGRRIGDESPQHHGHAVEGIVFSGKRRGGLGAVPVKGGGKDGLGEVAVGQPVGPVALPLEPARDGVFAQGLLMPAHLVQFGVAVEDIPHDDGHLGDELPVLVGGDHLGAGDDLGQLLTGVAVKTLPAVGADPSQGLVVLLMVVDLQGDAADDLGQIAPLGPDAEVFLEHLGVAVAAHDPHGDAAQVNVGFVLHPSHRHGAPGKTQDLFLHVSGDLAVAGVLHVMAVDREGRQALLGVGGQHRSQIHRAGAFGTVEAPDRLDGVGVHVKGLSPVTPAGSDGEGGHHVLGGELVLAGSCLRPAPYGGVRDHTLDRGAVGIAQRLLDPFLCLAGHGHGLFFQTFPHAAPAAVDGGPDADFGIQHLDYLPVFCNRVS